MSIKLLELEGERGEYVKIVGDTYGIKEKIKKIGGLFQSGGEGGKGWVFFNEDDQKKARKFMKKYKAGEIKIPPSSFEKRAMAAGTRPFSPGLGPRPIRSLAGRGMVSYPATFMAENGIAYQVIIYVLPLPQVGQEFRFYKEGEDESTNEMIVKAVEAVNGTVGKFTAYVKDKDESDEYEILVTNGRFSFAGDTEIYDFIFSPIEREEGVSEKKTKIRKSESIESKSSESE